MLEKKFSVFFINLKLIVLKCGIPKKLVFCQNVHICTNINICPVLRCSLLDMLRNKNTG